MKAFPLFIEKSRFTDDTVITVAVADALLYAGKDAGEDKICAAVVSSMQHWGGKYPKAGYGGKFREWLKEKEPKPYGSFGNGSTGFEFILIHPRHIRADLLCRPEEFADDIVLGIGVDA